MDANTSLKIIDPHCHLWGLSLGYHAWISAGESALLGSLKLISKNFLKEDYLKASKGFQVESVIHIESVSTCYALNEVEYLELFANTSPSGLLKLLIKLTRGGFECEIG